MIEVFENVCIGLYVLIGMLDMFKMTFSRGCHGMLSIHTLNYFIILFCGVRVASLVISISLLIVCCCPCFVILIVGALVQQRQRRVVREDLLTILFSIRYDKLYDSCPKIVPDIDTAECAICLGGFLDVEQQPKMATPLPCDLRHVFHTDCIREWFQRENKCPLCKTDITREMMQTVPNMIRR